MLAYAVMMVPTQWYHELAFFIKIVSNISPYGIIASNDACADCTFEKRENDGSVRDLG